MIVQKDFLNKLKDFGLNTYESKLWTALLSRGISTAGELSDIANVPRSRSYDVLEGLEKKGFIVMKLGKPIKYIAVSPDEVLERVKKKIQEDAEKQVESIKTLKASDVLAELNLLHTQGVDLVEPTDLSGSIRGRNNVYNHLELMIKNAKKSIVLMTTAQGLVRKSESLKSALAAAYKKGVKIKIAAPITKECANAVKELSSIAEIKHSEITKSRFLIIDEKETAFMLLDDKDVHSTYDACIWVNTGFFSTTLNSLFNSEWKGMKSASQMLK